MSTRRIDRDKLRGAIRRMSGEEIYYMLDDACDLLPDDKLAELAGGYLDLKKLQPDGQDKPDLPAAVRAFEKASLAGEYYEDFDVNSRNFMETSAGTRGWIAEFVRLMNRCVAAAEKEDLGRLRQPFDILFGLLDHIDEGRDDVIFFADEGGSWQVHVEWEEVLPVWFRILSATAGPEEYVEGVTLVVGNHCSYRKEALLAEAKETGTPAQRKAMALITDQNFDAEFGRVRAKMWATKNARREREAAKAREQHLDELAGSEAAAWKKVQALIASKNQRNYDEAVQLLIDLRDLDSRSAGNDFKKRLDALRQIHEKKRSFIRRLMRAEL